MKDELLENLFMRIEDLYKVEDRTINNELIATYYETLAHRGNNYEEKAKLLRQCGRRMWFTEFTNSKINDKKKAFLCKDHFCINCQSHKAKTRLIRYAPQLNKAQTTHDLYLLTLTDPNVAAGEYSHRVDRQIKAYAQLHRYLMGYDKIKGYCFKHLDYQGSICSHETTYNTARLDYNPHQHAMLALCPNLYLRKDIVNDYAYDYQTVYKDGERVRERITKPFSQLEIDIQKIWYLLINGEKVTGKAIDELELGYSARLDRADEKSYLEVFKYAIKTYDEDQQHIAFDQFKTLLYGLHGRKMLRGFGIFRNIKDTQDVDQEIKLNAYDTVISALHLVEKPKYGVYKSLSKVRDEMLNSDTLFINRRAVHSMSWADMQGLGDLAFAIIRDHNWNQSNPKFEIDPDKFFDQVRRKRELWAGEQVQAKEKELQRAKVHTERSKARTRYAKEKLAKLSIDRKSPLYTQSFLAAKIEFNNQNPIRQPKPILNEYGDTVPF